ncbi:S41 family peptidase [Roseiconus lacunae]|uniref:S41 family peptidase n=1 Tax=Roseiconus lacunae TaxID=2605694 RepID=A0ABT7PNM2_9BACT|nr:S41 family peptidase [Roseiconus lacunae]MCD0459323.1 S41 family peptidase [Roseiconus lacunae]MDM4018100.1 S41 family peptidase [Roseiconus lacunae]
MPSRNFNIILFAFVISWACHVQYRKMRTASIVGEAIDLIERHYVDPIDREQLLTSAILGVVGDLDEHSSYFAVDAYESFQDSMHQEFAGIGILVSQQDETQPVRVITPLVGSPALRAGLLPGDKIIRVNGVDVSAMKLPDVSNRLKGPPGTTVDLVVAREDGQQTMSVQRMTVRRATIELESVVGDHRDTDNRWVYRLKSNPAVAYVRLKSFGEKTVRELEAVLAELDNDFEALVLDLRDNGGGLLYAARDVANMFLTEGTIVSTRTRGGKLEKAYNADPDVLVAPDRPVAVLINGNSASASEIVAASLKDNGRAIIAGTRSYGKGTVQEIKPLQYGRSALRLTVAKYYRPNNRNIHRDADAGEDDDWGVRPTKGFDVPMTPSQLRTLAVRWDQASYPLLTDLDDRQWMQINSPPATDAELNEAIVPAIEPVPAIETADPPAPENDGRREEIPDALDPDPATGDAEASETPPNSGTIAVPNANHTDRQIEDRSVDSDASQTTSISGQAKQNVELGPTDLDYDPPLRAAVGALLRSLDENRATP